MMIVTFFAKLICPGTSRNSAIQALSMEYVLTSISEEWSISFKCPWPSVQLGESCNHWHFILTAFQKQAVQFRLFSYQSAFTKTHFTTSANTIHGRSLWLKQHSNHPIVTFTCTIQLESIKLHISFDHGACFKGLFAFLAFLINSHANQLGNHHFWSCSGGIHGSS